MMHSHWAARLVLLGCLVPLCLAASGCALQPSSSVADGVSRGTRSEPRLVATLPPPDVTGDQQSVTIGPSDVLAIDVFQVDDLDHVVVVDETGQITLPLIGPMQVAGETASMLERDIAARYDQRYLRAPVVSVSVKDSPGQRVTVDGQVKTSGLYPASAGSTLLQVIAQAGGVTEGADLGKVYVFRNCGGEQLAANYSIAAIRAGTVLDPKVYGGDVVIVFASGTHMFAQTLGELLSMAVDARDLL